MTPFARHQSIYLEQVAEICGHGHVVLLSVYCVLIIIM